MGLRFPQIATVADSSNTFWSEEISDFTGRPPVWGLPCSAYVLNNDGEIVFGSDFRVRFVVDEVVLEVITSRKQYELMVDFFVRQREISSANGHDPTFGEITKRPLYSQLKFVQSTDKTTKDALSIYSPIALTNLQADGQRFNSVRVRPDNVSIRSKLILTAV